MLVFVSDLHLADSELNSSADTLALGNRLNEIVSQTVIRSSETVRIVLLGDIFELLKSEEWITANVRPWEPVSTLHRQTVGKIFDEICTLHSVFFNRLRKIKESYPIVEYVYVPGNHDRPLNTQMGDSARRRFREILPVQGNDSQLFVEDFVDSRHRVIAKHGHQWDPVNRYTTSGKAAIGDAVVIELLVRLTILVREQLKLESDSPLLKMLQEVDNVRPQAPKFMAQWILSSLDKTTSASAKVLQGCLEHLISDFRSLCQSVEFESTEMATWWQRFLQALAEVCVKSFGVLSTSLVLPAGGDEPGPYSEFALSDIEISLSEGDHSYILCGHTHIPEIVPLMRGRDPSRPLVYMNTGAWRRVHRVAKYRKKNACFATWNEACIVTISSSEEQRQGISAYQFTRDLKG